MLFWFACSGHAQQLVPAQEQPPRYIARIELNTTDELMGVLGRAETLFESGNFKPGVDTPVAFVLHGSEGRALLRENYPQYRQLVDRAARLSAFQVIDIKVCRTWMGGEALDPSQLPPFVGTVPYGPGEEQRLLEQAEYVYF